jgi:hypothetical protein
VAAYSVYSEPFTSEDLLTHPQSENAPYRREKGPTGTGLLNITLPNFVVLGVAIILLFATIAVFLFGTTVS